MRALILGESGLIGNNILRAAVQAGWETVVFNPSRRRGHRPAALTDLEVEIANGLPNNPPDLRRAMRHCDVVCHANSYTPPNRFRHQHRLVEARDHIERVLVAAQEAKIGKLIYTSVAGTIGRSDLPTRLPDEWNWYRRGQFIHPYWDAKLVQEEAVRAFGPKTGIPAIILNPAEAIGPYDFGRQAVQPLLEIARRGSDDYLPGLISIADARDIAQGHLAAAEFGRAGERYLLAGHNLTRQEMAATMARACKRPIPDKPINLQSFLRLTRFSENIACLLRPNRSFPLGLRVEKAYRGGWYDSAKARTELGFSNRPLINTFHATLAWLREVKWLK